jgi:hypothetical protein
VLFHRELIAFIPTSRVDVQGHRRVSFLLCFLNVEFCIIAMAQEGKEVIIAA